ncbi:MAG: 50S ribosomal protein L30 [Bacteroidia bacterium]|nr:50S ribosomal protein L30 [Bacteroidia bacterium]
MAKVKLTLVKGVSKKTPVQRATVTALGFKRTNQVIEKELSPAVTGMINKVKHLLKVENI